MRVRPDSTRPTIERAVDLDSSAFNQVWVRMRTTGGQKLTLYWRPKGAPAFSDEYKYEWSIIPDGKFHDYHLLLGEHPLWNGRILALRLNLANWRAPIDLASISLEQVQVPLLVRLAARGESLSRLSIGQEVRNVVFAPPPYRTSATVRIPSGARLTFGYGVLENELGRPRPIAFEVYVARDGRRQRIFRDQPKSFSRNGRGPWFDAGVDLSAWAGKDARLEFVTTAQTDATASRSAGAWVVWSEPAICVPAAGQPTNVVLVVVDALRPDRLGCYGYGRPTSPNLDALARRSVIFRRAESQGPWTIPSMASMLTSHYPSETRDDMTPPSTMDARVTTFPTLLYRRGISTGAITAQTLLGPPAGYDQGFEQWNQRPAFMPTHPVKRSAANVTDAACAWLDRHAGQQFALYVHYMDTHYDWAPPEPYRSRFLRARGVTDADVLAGDADGILYRPDGAKVLADKRNMDCLASLYDGEIAYTDHEVQRLFDKLRRLRLYDQTLVVVIADHGEGLGEHGFLHGGTLYQEVLRVPLIIKPPRAEPVRRRDVSEWVRLLDIAPTVLDFSGIPVPRHMRGQSLRRALEHPQRPETNFAQTGVFKVLGVPHLEAARAGRNKVIHSFATDLWELYDVERDPRETADLAASQPEALNKMKRLVARFGRQARPGAAFTQRPLTQMPSTAKVDDEMRRRLRSLGYVQ